MSDQHRELNDCQHPDHADVWTCKIGFARRGDLPIGANAPMRRAVEKAYEEITGESPQFIFSGWCGALTATEAKTAASR